MPCSHKFGSEHRWRGDAAIYRERGVSGSISYGGKILNLGGRAREGRPSHLPVRPRSSLSLRTLHITTGALVKSSGSRPRHERLGLILSGGFDAAWYPLLILGRKAQQVFARGPIADRVRQPPSLLRE
jgi:hypothetical protein